MNRRQSFGWQDHQLTFNTKGPCLIRLVTRKKPQVHKQKPVIAYWSSLNYFPDSQNNKSEKKPNLIVVSLDTLRADHLKNQHYPRDTAPDLDRLCLDSIVFDNCWSQWHSTRVSHNSIFSGQFEETHQVPNLYPVTPAKIITITELLTRQGYLTAAITGSGWLSASFGLCKGFERYFDNETRQFGSLELADNWPLIERWLTEFAQRRFFLFIHTYQIHSPYPTLMEKYDSLYRTPAADDLDKMKLKTVPFTSSFDHLTYLSDGKAVTKEDQNLIQCMRDYYDGSIRCTNDLLIHPLLSTLDRLNIYDNTIIVLLSDHGEEFFDHGRFYHNDSLYEELIHVPMIIKPVNSRQNQKTISTPVQTVDLLPTLCQMMKIPDPESSSRDGRSLAHSIKTGQEPSSSTIFSQSLSKFAARKGNKKLILRCRVAPAEQSTIPRIEGYHLDSDPKELTPQQDDMTGYEELYRILNKRIISQHRGLHIHIPVQYQGRKICITIKNETESMPIKRIWEIGFTRQDNTKYDDNKQQVFSQIIGTSWPKELILEPRYEALQLQITVSVDGKPELMTQGQGLSLQNGLYVMNSANQPAKAQNSSNVITIYAVTKKFEPLYKQANISEETQKKLRSLGYLKSP